MNYIGSKQSLLGFIEESVNAIIPSDGCRTFCDLFAGTGVVGVHFKKKGYSVISNDLQYYSFVLNKQYIGNHQILSFSGLEVEIPMITNSLLPEFRCSIVCDYLDSLEGVDGFVYCNYSSGGTSKGNQERLYFTDYNARKCDAIRQKIEEWKKNEKITQGEYYFLLATLIENVDKVANTASVYGAFLKKIKSSAEKKLVMRQAQMILNDQEHTVFNEDANKLIRKIEMDVLYLDPPYNHRQYSANYHLLETIARYDNPSIKGKTGMRDYSQQKSSYCTKAKVIESFKDLIQNAAAKYIFLSYNNEGLMSFEEIQSIMALRGEYGCFEKVYSRFKADKSDARQHKANHTIEYLHYVKCNK